MNDYLSLSGTVYFCIDFYGDVCHWITDFAILSISKSVPKSGIYVVVYFFISFLSLFVSTSLAYITIPQNKRKTKIT